MENQAMRKINKTILIVEDQILIAMSEKIALENYGYSVITANSGETAVEMLEGRLAVDLILMDIDLGKGIDGTETAGIILRNHDVPIVFLSSHTETAIVEKTEKISSYGYVVKNSGITILDASIKMAFKLFEAYEKTKSINNKLEATLDALPDLLFEVGLDGCYYDYHSTHAELLNDPASEALGKRISDILPANIVPIVMSAIQEAHGKGLSVGRQYSLAMPTGDRRYEIAVSRKSSLPHEPRFMLIIRDITDRKRMEESLIASEKRYRRLFEAAKDGILILDADSGKIMDVNPYLIEMLGFSKEQFLEKTIWEIGTFQNIIANKDNFLELQKEGYIRYENLPLETAYGDTVDVEFVSNVYFADNHKVIQCNIRNIEKRKQAEEVRNVSEVRYRRLFETAQTGILILDAESGKIVDVNPYLIRLLGFSKAEFAEKTIWEIGAFKDIVANKENFSELQQKEYLRYEDLPLENAKGEIVEVEFISNVYLVDNKKVIQCNIRNITDRKIAEELIVTLFAEKELILREGHHRIKNNMSTISSLLSLQAETLTNPEAIAALRDAGSRIESMMMLYKKLYQSDNFNSVNVADYLPSLVDEILANFPNGGSVKVESEIEDFHLAANVLQPLGIIINELMTNIMKYAFAGIGPGTIRIRASKKGDSITMSIEDNGHGIPESVDFANTPGFGLMLVNMLTKQLQGKIRIERGKGTRVILEFGV
jgi:PAS domain S-box-containing protein